MRIRGYLIAFLIFYYTGTLSQSNSNNAYGYGIATDKSGNLFITGHFEGMVIFGRFILNDMGNGDIFLAKFNPQGTCLWAVSAGSKNADISKSIGLDAMGNIYISGYIGGAAFFDDNMIISNVSSSMFVAKYNPSGDVMWVQTTKGESSSSYANALKVDAKGNCYVAGTISGTVSFNSKISFSIQGNSFNDDIFIAKYSSAGKCIWVVKAGGVKNDVANSIGLDKSENIIITGDFSGNAVFDDKQISSSGGTDVFIAKYNNSGNIIWVNSIGNADNNSGNLVSVTNKDDLFLTGVDFNPVRYNPQTMIIGYYNVFLSKYDALGKLIWSKRISSKSNIYVYGAYADITGNCYITGIYSDTSYFDKITLCNINQKEDVYLSKYSPNGDCLWSKSGSAIDNSEGRSITPYSDNNIYCLGNFKATIEFGKNVLSIEKGVESVFVAKFDANGNCNMAKRICGPGLSSMYDPNAKYLNYKAKLLVSNENKQSFLSNQSIMLKDSSDVEISTTASDEHGDFSFRQIDGNKTYSLVLQKNNATTNGEIFLATQNGQVLKKITSSDTNSVIHKVTQNEMDTLVALRQMEFIALQQNEEDIQTLSDFSKTVNKKDLTIKKQIAYDEDVVDLSNETKEILVHIDKILRQKKNLHLEIYSYTSSLGDDNHNLELSQKRAKVIKDFFISKNIVNDRSRNIVEDRITAIGMGEAKILNRCFNGVECSEKEHNYNLRTEFRFIKK